MILQYFKSMSSCQKHLSIVTPQLKKILIAIFINNYYNALIKNDDISVWFCMISLFNGPSPFMRYLMAKPSL